MDGYGTLRLHDGADRLPVDAAVETFVTRTHEVVPGAVALGLDEVAVAEPVGGHEPSELRQELSGEGVVAAEALRLGDKRSSRSASPSASAGTALQRYVDRRTHTTGRPRSCSA